MSTITGNKISEVATTTEIDWLGLRFGLIRDDNESLSDFRERVISALVWPNSISETGTSMSLTRAMISSPKVIGFLSLSSSLYIRNSGSRIILMTDPNTEIKTYEVGEDYTLHDLDSFLQDTGLGSINYIDKYKWRCKNLSFILPFANFENRRNFTANEGANILTDRYIVDGSIVSDSDYIKTRVVSPSLITKKGEYYHEGSTFITYDSGEFREVAISYAMKWDIVPIVYTPIRAVSLSTISRTSDINNYENKMNKVIDGTEENTFVEFDPLYKDLFWNAIVKNNALWKANENNPVSVNGTYYAK